MRSITLKTPRTAMLAGGIILGLMLNAGAAFVPFSDQFNDLSGWSTSGVNNGAAPTIESGSLVLNTSGTNVNAASVVRSANAVYNPFEQAYSVSLSGIQFSGSPGATGRNVAYLMIGRTQDSTTGGVSGTGNYTPGTNPRDGNSTLTVRLMQTMATGYTLSVYSNSGSGVAYSIENARLSAVPTGITFSMAANSQDILTWTLDIVGASFTATSSNSISGSFAAAVTSASLENAYISSGAWINYQATSAPTVFRIDGMDVVAIPELGTSSVLLGVLALLAVAVAARRRKR